MPAGGSSSSSSDSAMVASPRCILSLQISLGDPNNILANHAWPLRTAVTHPRRPPTGMLGHDGWGEIFLIF
jgi:hypothetical protein